MPFITKRHIHRRTFLKGAGVTLALPVLDAMLPAGTALAQTVAAQSPSRFVGIFYPHGMGPGFWEPAAEGPLPEKLPYILEGLDKLSLQNRLREAMAKGAALERGFKLMEGDNKKIYFQAPAGIPGLGALEAACRAKYASFSAPVALIVVTGSGRPFVTRPSGAIQSTR